MLVWESHQLFLRFKQCVQRPGPQVAFGRNAVQASRKRVAQSLELLKRTRRPDISELGAKEDGLHFKPIVIDGVEDPLTTISDLIEFIRRTGKGTSVLRDELFVAAALPSPERARGIRAMAVVNLRALGVKAS